MVVGLICFGNLLFSWIVAAEAANALFPVHERPLSWMPTTPNTPAASFN